MIEDRFPICFPFTHSQECPFPDDWNNPKNFSDDRHDPGGKTFHGVIQREYDLWRKGQSLPTQDVRRMIEDECLEIYCSGYWMTKAPLLPIGLDLEFFDTCVNMGATEAIKILQFTLGVPADGMWGPETDAAVTLSTQELTKNIQAFTNRRIAVYKELKGFPYFGTDWVRRAQEIGAEALKMAA
jgi:lysozyme family protein